MKIHKLIREFIEESLVEENKDRLIDRLSISSSQKRELKEMFKKYPHLEGGTPDHKIDWNKVKSLTWEDFQPVLNYESKHGASKEQKRKVKSQGISGLKIGTDYIPVTAVQYDSSIDISELNEYCFYEATGNEELVGIYIPLTWEASKLIASDKVENTEGKWCTAYKGLPKYWDSYMFAEKSVMLYVVYKETKYAIKVKPYKDFRWGVWDELDKPQMGCSENIPGIDVDNLIKANKKLFYSVSEHILSKAPFVEILDRRGDRLWIGYGGNAFKERLIYQEKLVGAELSDRDLDQVQLVECNLLNSNLDGVVIRKAIIKDCNVTKSSAIGIDLENTVLVNSDFSVVDFTQANLNSTNITSTVFIDTIFKNTNMDNVFGGGNMFSGCDFTSVKIDKYSPKFIDTKLYNCNFSKLKLSNVILDRNIIKSSDFTNCSLIHADLSNIESEFTDFSGSNMTSIDFSHSEMYKCTFTDCNFTLGNFQFSKLDSCDFSNSSMEFTTFFCTTKNCNFTGCDFTGCDLSKGLFLDCDFTDVIWGDNVMNDNGLITNNKKKDEPSRKFTNLDDVLADDTLGLLD